MDEEARRELIKRLYKAAHRASEAFWAEVAKAFPECTTGDFAPDQSIAWEMAVVDAVSGWVHNNLPESTIESLELDEVPFSDKERLKIREGI